MPESNPVLVEVVRGGVVESRHRGAVVLMRADGAMPAALGDARAPMFPRSANKPLQALPFVETGAADAFGCGEAEIALASASHYGQPEHLAVLEAWAARIGVTESDLGCGAHMPYDGATAEAMIRAGTAATRFHNNCAGKHLGFLTTARHLGEPIAGYLDYAHPVQRRVTAALSAMYGEDLDPHAWGVDGCGVPTITVSLAGLAHGMARLAAPDRLGAGRAQACRRIIRAMAAEPLMVSGTASFTTTMLARLKGRAVIKVGAEGVYAGAVPGRALGFAVKIDDGAERAADIVTASLLLVLGVGEAGDFGDVATQPVTNRMDEKVGIIRPAGDLLSFRAALLKSLAA